MCLRLSRKTLTWLLGAHHLLQEGLISPPQLHWSEALAIRGKGGQGLPGELAVHPLGTSPPVCTHPELLYKGISKRRAELVPSRMAGGCLHCKERPEELGAQGPQPGVCLPKCPFPGPLSRQYPSLPLHKRPSRTTVSSSL